MHPTGGLPRRATLVSRLRAEHPALLAVDTGDALFGPGAAQLTEADRRRADIESQAFAKLNYAALGVGELDLRDGSASLLARMAREKLPYLAANLADASGAHPFPGERVVDTPLGKVGFAAVTVLDHDVGGLHAEDAAAALKKSAAQLRAQPLVAVVALVHAPADKVQAILDGAGVELALVGHDGATRMVTRSPPSYAAGQKGRSVAQLLLQLGPEALVDGNAEQDAADEVKLLDTLYGTLQSRLATANNDQARAAMRKQMELNRDRRAEAQKRAESPRAGRTVTNRALALDEKVDDEPGLAAVVNAEIAADGHAPGR